MKKRRRQIKKDIKRNSKTVIIEDSKSEKKPRKRRWTYWLYVLLGSMVVVSFLIFLSYNSLKVLFPWMFGTAVGGTTTVEHKYANVVIPVWDETKASWDFVRKDIADAGLQFTVSYAYSQFTASYGFTVGYIVDDKPRVVSVEGKGDTWNVYLMGGGIPFYSSYRIRQLVCDALNTIEDSLKLKVSVNYDGKDIRDYIPCGGSDGYIVFYARGSSIRARWIYDNGVNKADVVSYFMKVLKEADMMGDTDFSDIVEQISYSDGSVKVRVKGGSFVNATTPIKNTLIYNMMYLYPDVQNIVIEDPETFPYTDVRLDPIILIPTSSEDFLAMIGDRFSYVDRLQSLYPEISQIKVGDGKAIVDFKKLPTRETVEAIVRSLISSKSISSVILSVNGEVPTFWIDPFVEDF